jgi:hypothetical protein
MLLRWIGQKLVFPTTHLDGTNVVLVYSCLLLRCEKIPAEVAFNF